MAMFYEIEKLLSAPIEDVLQKLYPVTVFKWLYDINLRKLQETHPDALPQPDRASRFGSDKTLKKSLPDHPSAGGSQR